jgi:DHA1 family multidrug resistance protein-like MFS transporter
LKYPEEEESWQCPSSYTDPADHYDKQMEALRAINEHEAASGPVEPPVDPEKREEVEDDPAEHSSTDADATTAAELAKFDTQLEADEAHFEGIKGTTTTKSRVSRVASRQALSQSHTRAELEEAFRQATLEQGPSVAITPTKLADGTVLVDWYTTDDPANPQNWSLGKKLFVTFQICLYTTAVYMGSSIYSPAEFGVMERFGVNIQLASMGLSMYVLAYGIGVSTRQFAGDHAR